MSKRIYSRAIVACFAAIAFCAPGLAGATATSYTYAPAPIEVVAADVALPADILLAKLTKEEKEQLKEQKQTFKEQQKAEKKAEKQRQKEFKEEQKAEKKQFKEYEKCIKKNGFGFPGCPPSAT